MKDEEKRMSREEELDRFWDIGALLPRQKPVFSRSANTDTAEIELPERPSASQSTVKSQAIPKDTEEARVIRRFIPPHTAEEEKAVPKPEMEYTPDNALIRHVRIYRPKSNYQYYEAFVRDAKRLYPIHGEPCERMTFFSYVPQYSQMNRAQLEWYLWWRECVRRGEYLQTDYSYVLLYLYELINLSEHLDPQHVQDSMLAIWENYREIYHQLDGYLAEWVCDFSLLHRLTTPKNLSAKLMTAAMTHSNLKEFYFSSDASLGYAGALLAFCNNYDYKKSKFCTGENADLFDRVIPKVINLVVDSLSADGNLFSATRMDDSKVMRNAFTGALCACSIKRNIEVEYCSFSRSNELRYFITDVVKYTENLLRAHLGIRSRLTVYSLPNTVREQIDRFMADALPQRPIAKKVRKEPAEEAYEKLYDLPKSPLSLANAAEIEKSSWNTTEKLIEAFSDEEEPTTSSQVFEPILPPIEEVQFTEREEGDDALFARLQDFLPFLRAVQASDFALQKRIAAELGRLPDTIADEINEIAADCMGDILIEDDGEGYVPISDYEDILLTLTEDR